MVTHTGYGYELQQCKNIQRFFFFLNQAIVVVKDKVDK